MLEILFLYEFSLHLNFCYNVNSFFFYNTKSLFSLYVMYSQM